MTRLVPGFPDLLPAGTELCTGLLPPLPRDQGSALHTLQHLVQFIRLRGDAREAFGAMGQDAAEKRQWRGMSTQC